MMKFEDMQYQRISYDVVKEKFETLLKQLRDSESATVFLKHFWKMQNLMNEVQNMEILCHIRNSINSEDAFYDAENTYWNETGPKLLVFTNELYKIMLEKPYRQELLKEIPETYFKMAEYALKIFNESIVEDLQKENKLSSEYMKLKATAQVPFKEEVLNLSQFKPKFGSVDRALRKEACDTYFQFFKDNKEKFEDIFDQLVKVRTTIAKKLGFENYIEVAYYAMNRFDYDAEMVKNYRRQVLEEVTPYVSELFEEQAKRIQVDHITYYDKEFEYASGNPTPKGTFDEQIHETRKMYHEMSEETKEFIDFMIQNNLWDLQSKPGKNMGGYCLFIPKYKSPYIFANFNGTSGDVDVLTHEAGHAFQVYMSRHIPIFSCVFPTYESCEIHSMSMEFFAYPWMKNFFKEDTAKYYAQHLEGSIRFLPYGVLVDHFQHEVYANPHMSKSARNLVWRELEKKYMPYLNYEGCEFLEEGCWWFQQNHIFTSPFYYIDYTLAQVCAFQFLEKMHKNRKEAWEDYLRICKIGGTQSFVNIVQSGHLKVPFEDGTIASIMAFLKPYLASLKENVKE